MGRTDRANVRPGDDVFIEYWDLRKRLAAGQPRARARALGGVMRTAVDLGRAWLRTRRITVRVSRVADGRLVADQLSHRVGRLRVARPWLCVLEMPSDADEYMLGPPAKNRRNNVRRANALGITVSPLPEGQAGEDLYARCNAGRMAAEDGAKAHLDAIGTVSLIGCDANGDPLCVGIAIVDGEDAALTRLVSVSSEDSDEGLRASWLVHVELVKLLIEGGVRRLWLDGPLTTSPGSHFFAKNLGYICARARLVSHS